MTIKKAKEILSKNVLDLSMVGLDYMPMRTVEIETFEIMNKSKSNPNDTETTCHEKAYLLGLVDKNKNSSSGQYSPTGDLICRSFFVNVWHDYYYREFFCDAMEVIQALRILNEYKDPYPDESITITL
jgi:hypothetical protein